MKNKNIGGCVLSTQPYQQKRPQCKNAQNMLQKYQTLNIFPRSFRSLGILKIHISGAAYRHAQVQYVKYVFFFFFCFFFLSNHHDTNPLLHLYHIRKKYNYVLANIYSESSRV